MSKKVLILIMSMLLCVGMLTGCKKNVGTSEDNAMVEETEEESAYRFGFSCITMENPYFITLEKSLREGIEKKGYTLICEDPGADVDKQIEQIKNMISDGIDAIFLCPVSWEKITPALEALKAADVKIINIDSEVKEMDYIDAYIGSDNKEAGKICGQDLIETHPEGGKIVILESSNQNSINDRIIGFEEAIAGEGFEVIARAETNGDLNIAREEAEEIFKEHKDIVAVMCGNDQIALGALVAARTAGMSNISIYGVDGSPDLKKELAKQDTLIRGTCGQSPINIGKKAAEIGIAILDGKEYEEKTYEDVYFIDTENIQLYGIDGWQ